MLLEYVQHIGKCSCLVCGTEDYRGLVFAGRPGIVPADSQKAGDIVRDVLDVFADHFQTVQLGGNG